MPPRPFFCLRAVHHVQLPRRKAHSSHSSPPGLTHVPTSAPFARVENSSCPPRCRQYVEAGFAMPTRGGSASSAGGGVFGAIAGGGAGTGRATGAGGNVVTGADGKGAGAGWMVVRGGCHGGIGDEQAANPIASTQTTAAAAWRPWPASLARQTARFMRFLPGGLVERTQQACLPRLG